MRKLFMLFVAALALTTWSFAQAQNNSANDQDKDNAAKQDMKKAGHETKEAAKATGRGVKNGAKWTKDRVTTTTKTRIAIGFRRRTAMLDRNRTDAECATV